MTKQEAIAVLQQRIDVIEDDQAYSMLTKSMYEDGYRRIEAFKMAIAALNEPVSPTTQLDENGLMPCRCGGKAEIVRAIEYWDWIAQNKVEVKKVQCDKCYVSTPGSVTNEYAMQKWNTAMGWRADDET